VARKEHHDAVRNALGTGTLHGWAATQPGARAMRGRGVAWATRLPNGTEVVVRHSRHGGALARLTGDLFLAPTRAPRELDNAIRLQAAGVQTPTVIAYVVYRAFGPLCRADVVTALVNGVELPDAVVAADDTGRAAIAGAVRALVEAMGDARAHHPDLNAKNILVETRGRDRAAWVIDVDRVTFGGDNPAAVRGDNTMRLWRSVMKLRQNGAFPVDDNVIRQFFRVLGVEYSSAESAT
jgi:hypothetical protein